MAKEIYKDDIRSFLIDDGHLIIKKKGENDLKFWLKGLRIDDNIPSNIIPTLNKMGIKPEDRIAVYWLLGGKNPLIITKVVKNQLQKEIDSYKAEYQAKEAEREAESRDPANIERNAISKLYADAYRIENSGREDNVMTSIGLRHKADIRLKAWREKYPEKAKKEEADKLIAKAEREEELAKGALFYDADGWLSKEDQQRRHDEGMAKAKEYRKQAEELLNPPKPESKAGDKTPAKEPETLDQKLDKINKAVLEQKQSSRTALSQSSDKARKHSVTITPENPKAKRWLKDPGSMDIVGIDIPPSIGKLPKPKKQKQPPLKATKEGKMIRIKGSGLARTRPRGRLI